jgi:hypothetical protein
LLRSRLLGGLPPRAFDHPALDATLQAAGVDP